MRFTTALFFASTASALSFPDIPSVKSLFARTLDSASGTLSSRDSTCPAVWTQISKALTTKFLTNGQCNPDARAAIRAVFHDCGGGFFIPLTLVVVPNTHQHGRHLSEPKAAAMAA
jgi:hypothetical protein